MAAGGVEAHWEKIAGADLAAHVACEPTDTPEGRVLILRADSTAWATQVRLLLPEIHRRIEAVLGRSVSDPIRVVGPAPPTRAMGPRRVPGRGPAIRTAECHPVLYVNLFRPFYTIFTIFGDVQQRRTGAVQGVRRGGARTGGCAYGEQDAHGIPRGV